MSSRILFLETQRQGECQLPDVHDVVDTACEGNVAVRFALAAIAGDVVAWPCGEINLFESLVVAIESASHAWPSAVDAQVACAGAVLGFAILVQHDGPHAEEWQGCGARLQIPSAGKRRDHGGAGFGLPPSIDDRAPSLAHCSVVPEPCLRVDGFADRPEQAEARHVVLGDVLVTERLQGSNCRRRRVEDGHAVLLDDLPPPAGRRVHRHSLEDNLCGAVQERAVANVGVAGDPSTVCRAPVQQKVPLP